MIFLSLPYRADDEQLVESRVNAGRKACSFLLSQDFAVHCPVVAFHETMKLKDSVERSYEAWEIMIEEMIVHSTEVVILKLPGFSVSEGVMGEIELANKYQRDISYLGLERPGINTAEVSYSYEIQDAVDVCRESNGKKHVERKCGCFPCEASFNLKHPA